MHPGLHLPPSRAVGEKKEREPLQKQTACAQVQGPTCLFKQIDKVWVKIFVFGPHHKGQLWQADCCGTAG